MIGILSVSSESMATTEIRVKVMAAEDLKKDGRFRKMNVYTLMWIDPTAKQSTRVHRKGGRFPQWNDELVFYLGEDVPIFPHSTITIQVVRHRRRKENKLLGTTYLSLVEMARIKAMKDDPQEYDVVQLQLTTPSGHVQGYISLSISLMERSSNGANPSAEPVIGYPVGFPADMAYHNSFQSQSEPHEVPQQVSRAVVLHSSNSRSDFPVPTRPAGAAPYFLRRHEESSPFVQAPQPYGPSSDQRPRRHHQEISALALIGGAIGGVLLGDLMF